MNEEDVALRRVNILFQLAEEVVHDNPRLAQRYIEIARRISMRSRLHLPKHLRRLVCRRCKRFLVPGVNCRVRIQPRREAHVVVTCLICGGYMRIPLKGRKRLLAPRIKK